MAIRSPVAGKLGKKNESSDPVTEIVEGVEWGALESGRSDFDATRPIAGRAGSQRLPISLVHERAKNKETRRNWNDASRTTIAAARRARNCRSPSTEIGRGPQAGTWKRGRHSSLPKLFGEGALLTCFTGD